MDKHIKLLYIFIRRIADLTGVVLLLLALWFALR